MWFRFVVFWEFDLLLWVVRVFEIGLFIWVDNIDLCFFIVVV